MSEQPEGDLTDRVERLETGQQTITEKLDELLGITHARAEKQEEQRLDRPSTVAEQVRAELARAEEEKAAEQKRAEKEAEQETLAQRLARLEESPPVQPQPRRQRIMWGPR